MRLALLVLLLPIAAQAQSVDYRYDDLSDNTTSGNIGPPSTFDPDMLWGNYFLTEPGGEAIVEMSVAFGPTFPSRANPVTLWLLNDPDGDLDPRNATAVASAVIAGPIMGTEFYKVTIPPTLVGAGFFVGANVQALGGQDRPARLDNNAPINDRSWLFYADTIATHIDSLSTAPYGIRIDAAFPGAFLVRAVGQPVTVATEPAITEALHLTAAPNPLRGTSLLRYSMETPGPVSLTVHDALGRTVATLVNEHQGAGDAAVRFDASRLAPGVYVARLAADGRTEALRLIVAR